MRRIVAAAAPRAISTDYLRTSDYLRSTRHRCRHRSDPRATLRVSGTELEAQSTVKKKNLNPRWCEVFSFPYTPGSENENPPFLDVILEDVDQLSAGDFMGRVRVDLNPIKDHTRLRKWFPLQADAEGVGVKESSNVIGDVELVVQWRYSAALRFAPFDDVVEKEVPAGKTPNELRVAAITARRLAVKDKKLIGKGGTSDPVVRFKLGSVECETTVKKKTLNPTWNEAHTLPCSVQEAGETPTLEVICEDWDAASGRDFAGKATIDLSDWTDATSKKSAVRTWCLLDLDDGKKTESVSGEVEIWYQWRWNPLLDFEPFQDSDGDTTKAPNALRVGLSQARGLAVMDKAMVYGTGSSDPRCVLSLVNADGKVTGEPYTSAHQSKTLEPKWREVHEFDCEDASLKLRVVCEDYDALSGADFMGEISVGLDELPDQKVVRVWKPLTNPKGECQGEVELVLQWSCAAV